MQTLRKKTSPCKYKNEPSRFLGEGVTFKAKLIGILKVKEARGDKMCQEALLELKTAVRAAGEHKQRINIVIAVDGIRLKDEKTGDCLHHHPVHKISFIAQDVANSRAFGYIFGSPGTSHRFFGIKTDKAASQVVMTMRDLFQVVYKLKKREIDKAKQNIEQHQLKYGNSFLLDSMSSSSSKCSGVDQIIRKPVSKEDTMNKSVKNKTQTASVMIDLLDLELELNSLQQGLSHMETFTSSDPFGRTLSQTEEDPFGDSFTLPPFITTPPPAKLPPPPTTGNRRKRGSSSSATSQLDLHWFEKETQELLFNEKKSTINEPNKNGESFCHSEILEPTSRHLYDIFMELDPLVISQSKPYIDRKDFFQEIKNPPKKQLVELKREICSISAHDIPVSTIDDDHLRKNYLGDSPCQRITLAERLAKSSNISCEPNLDPFETSFANFVSFDGEHSSNQASSDRSSVPRCSPLFHTCQQSPNSCIENMASSQAFKTSSNSRSSVYKSMVGGDYIDSSSTYEPFLRQKGNPTKQKIVINLRKVLSNVDDTDENDSPVEETIALKKRDTIASPSARGEDISSDSFESLPQPPPRPITSPLNNHPPTLSPKKAHLPVTLKLPQQTSSNTSSRYDSISKKQEKSSKSSLNITISQLTNTGFDDLATVLKIPAFQISNMTLKKLTECLSKLSDAECQKLEENMNSKKSEESVNKDSRLSYQSLNESTDKDTAKYKVNFEDIFPYRTSISLALSRDKYAVFRELNDQKGKISSPRSVHEITKLVHSYADIKSADEKDRYAALNILLYEDKNKEKNKAEDEKILQSVQDDEMEDEKPCDINSKAADDVKADISIEPLNPETVTIETHGDDERCKTCEEVTPSETAAVVGKNWAKFEEQEGKMSLSWQDKQVQPFKYKKQKPRRYWKDDDDEVDFEDDDNDEDSEENCSLNESAASSLDDSSWRENGWSDRDSLYDEDTETYHDHYQFKREGCLHKNSPRNMVEHLPCEEKEVTWSTSGHIGRHEQRYDRWKPWTSPRSGAKNERKRFSTRETNELALLKMMLGKKRLKALEKQIFKQFQEQLEKLPPKKYSARGNPKQYKGPLSLSCQLTDRQYEGTKGFKYHGKKHYIAQRLKSANKGNKLLLVPDTEKQILSKKYRKPYSLYEHSISDDNRWTTASIRSPNFNNLSKSCNHSRNSPFENNFTPTQVYEFSADNVELAPPPVKSPTSSFTTPPLNSRRQAKFLTMTKASEMKKQSELHPGYSSYIRHNREPFFEDDFLAPINVVNQKSEKERASLDDEVFYIINKSATSHRYEVKRTTGEEANKEHFENVELLKKSSPSSVVKNITQSRE